VPCPNAQGCLDSAFLFCPDSGDRRASSRPVLERGVGLWEEGWGVGEAVVVVVAADGE
jgi:hypothetical protein